MNYSKMTKAQLIEMIEGLKDEPVHMHEQQQAEDSSLPWEEQPVVQVQYVKAETHAEIMRERLAAAKAQAMSSGRAVKA